MASRKKAQPSVGDDGFLSRLIERSDQVLIKKLSNNDRLWSRQKLDDDGNPVPGRRMNNQAGVYIPHEERDSGFFLPLELKVRMDDKLDEIRELFVKTAWPQVDGAEGRSLGKPQQSRLVNYRSKGQETHLTRLPKELFKELLPASFLVMGRTGVDGGFLYECLTIDSDSEEALLLVDVFELLPDFVCGVFEPDSLRAAEREKVLDFVDQVIKAWLAGDIAAFAAINATMPSTVELARAARDTFMKTHGLTALDPFSLTHPGNALREISRSIELEIFRDFQRRERAVELVRLVMGDQPKAMTPADVIRRLVDELPAIDAMMLSAAQQRKSRAGYSYEHHIEAMLTGGNIPHQKQVVLASKKRPDFVLPSLAFVDSGREEAGTGLILSAKTTLRERWKQVEREMGGRDLYLSTVDENVAGSAIEDMASIGVKLVVPESLMSAKETEYSGHANVLSFADFCGKRVGPNLRLWAQ